MLLARRTRLVLPLVALCGCSGEADDPPTPGGQTGEENGEPCVRVRSETLSSTQRSPLGFSAEELLVALGSERRQTLTWRDGTSTPAHLGVAARPGDVSFVERAPAAEPSGAEPAFAECPTLLSVPAVFTLATDDLSLDEAWDVVLEATREDGAFVFQRLELDALRGGFRLEQLYPTRADEIEVFLSAGLSATSWSGSLVGQAQRSNGGSGPDSSVSAEELSIATF